MDAVSTIALRSDLLHPLPHGGLLTWVWMEAWLESEAWVESLVWDRDQEFFPFGLLGKKIE
jgi:hypothetical protein